MDPIYIPQIITVKINLDPSELSANYEDKLKRKIKDKYGDICYLNGFIKKSSIEIVRIHNGRRLGAHLHGFLTFVIDFKALFCIPRKDQLIRCKIKTINKFGALATSYPMEVLVPRQVQQHHNMEIFATLKENDIVYVKTLNHTIRDDKLIVVGTIVELSLDKPNSLYIPNDAVLSPDYNANITVSTTLPIANKLLGSNESLNQLKTKITPHADTWTNLIRYLINPYELIDIYRPDSHASKKYNKSIIKYDVKGKNGVYPIFSRAYFKLWEILNELNLLNQFKNKNIRIGNIAEGPGGFIQSLLDYRNQQNDGEWKNDEYYAITLKQTPKLNKVLDWHSNKAHTYFQMMNEKGYNINLSYGSGTGNLLQIENIKHFTDVDLKNQKCQLVTADGGIELENDQEFSVQELANAKLFFAEILTALTIQDVDGIFIIKVYDIYYDLTLQMMMLLSIYYDSITIIKPRTSRPANSEKYIVCTGFNQIEQEKLNELYEIFEKWLSIEPNDSYLENNEFVNTIATFVENNGSEFQKQVVDFNDYNITMQIEKITEGLNLIASQDVHKKDVINAYKINQKELAIKWCQMFKMPYIEDLKLK